MPDGLETFFNQESRLFMEGDMDRLASNYMLPFHVMAMQRVARFETKNELIDTMVKTRAFLLENGISAMRPEVAALGLTRNHRRSVWVNWIFTGPELANPVCNRVQYIMTQPSPNSPHLAELMEYSDMKFPQIMDFLPLL